MEENSLRALEFARIRESVADKCFMSAGSEKALLLEPSNNFSFVRKELDIVRDLIDLKKFDGGIDLDGVVSIEDALRGASIIGAFLEPEQLFYIKRNLTIFRKIKNVFAENQAKYKILYHNYKEVQVFKSIEDMIEKAVDDEKKIKDDASLELRDIRESKKNLNETIRRKFDEIVANPDYSQALQEKIVTIRDGRFVVPVKADFKGQIKGIEHDRSASGVTVFIEPLAVVSLNNKIRELEAREREEIRKILLRLTDFIRANSEGIKELMTALEDVDFVNAKAEYALEKGCIVPKINEKEYVKIENGRHPLIPKEKMIPVSLEIGKKDNIILITGPNTGGKTVTLKTVGLITVMALSGIPVPAGENTDIGVFTSVFADIGDEQSIEQSLSSFSGHVTNIKGILDNVTRNSLVLLDELGSGTDPIEGAALAIAIIEHLRERKVKALITTHYSEVKAYGYNCEGIESASMEFDVETLSPTYKLMLGIPGRSNALIIAKKIGLNSGIIDDAAGRIGKENTELEGMITEIKSKSEEIDNVREELKKREEEIEKLKADYEQKLVDIEKEKNKIVEEAYKKSEELLKNMQSKAKALVDKIQTEETKKEEAKEAQKNINMLMRALKEEKEKSVVKEEKKEIKIDFKEGDKVTIKSMNRDAVVIKINKNKGEAQVQAGILKLVVELTDIAKEEKKNERNIVKSHSIKRYNVRNEIDLRGKMVDEALHELDIYLDGAVMTGYKEVFVIHGKGTGKLREGIQEYLDTARYVESYRDGNYNEGGTGCTVVLLRG